MKEFFSKIKTLYLNWNYLKTQFFNTLTKLNAERLMAKIIKDKKYLLEYGHPDKENFKKYKAICDRFNPSNEIKMTFEDETKLNKLRANGELPIN